MSKAMASWGFAASFVIALVVACGGDEAQSGAPGGTGALCGVNGTDQCAKSGKRCDKALGCVDCTGDGDCAGSARFCVRGRCEACRTNADCGAAAPSCWPADHTCHPACAGSGSCTGAAPLCDAATGACVGCLAPGDCQAPNAVCDPVTRRCAQCVSDDDCPTAAPRCLVRQTRCVQCTSNRDCGASTPICDPEELRCRAGCTSDEQCKNGATGANGVTPTPLCDLAQSRCVQCRVHADCAGAAASSGAKLCGKEGRCVPCLADQDCGPAAPFCKGEACVQCRKDEDCKDPSAPKCKEGGLCRP